MNNIVVRLKGNRSFEHMSNKHVMECLMCSFGCPFSVLESMLLKGLTIEDKFGNKYRILDLTPHIASRGGRKSKNVIDDSQLKMEV